MRETIIILSILFMAGIVIADINIEFSNLNVSDYQVEVYAPNKTLLHSVGFDNNFSVDATDDYIIQLKPRQPEILNESNIVPFIEGRLDRFRVMAWFFGFLLFSIVLVYFLVNLIPNRTRG